MLQTLAVHNLVCSKHVGMESSSCRASMFSLVFPLADGLLRTGRHSLPKDFLKAKSQK